MFSKDPSVLPLILISVLLTSGSQLVLKIGMASAPVQNVLVMRREGLIGPGSLLIGLGSHPAVVAGLFCYGLSANADQFGNVLTLLLVRHGVYDFRRT